MLICSGRLGTGGRPRPRPSRTTMPPSNTPRRADPRETRERLHRDGTRLTTLYSLWSKTMGMGAIPCQVGRSSRSTCKPCCPKPGRSCNRLCNATRSLSMTLPRRSAMKRRLSTTRMMLTRRSQKSLRPLCPSSSATTFEESFLELEFGYYHEEVGSCYDELEPGANWFVGGMRHFTPAGKKFQDTIAQKSWIVYGWPPICLFRRFGASR